MTKVYVVFEADDPYHGHGRLQMVCSSKEKMMNCLLGDDYNPKKEKIKKNTTRYGTYFTLYKKDEQEKGKWGETDTYAVEIELNELVK